MITFNISPYTHYNYQFSKLWKYFYIIIYLEFGSGFWFRLYASISVNFFFNYTSIGTWYIFMSILIIYIVINYNNFNIIILNIFYFLFNNRTMQIIIIVKLAYSLYLINTCNYFKKQLIIFILNIIFIYYCTLDSMLKISLNMESILFKIMYTFI